jgi:IS30 family transposase
MLRAVVEEKLELRWSPQQISGWLSRAYAGCEAMRSSHETIYLSLFEPVARRVAPRADRAAAVRPRDAASPGAGRRRRGAVRSLASCWSASDPRRQMIARSRGIGRAICCAASCCLGDRDLG